MASRWLWIAAIVGVWAVGVNSEITWDDEVATRLVDSDVTPARVVDVMTNILVRKLRIKGEDQVKQLRSVPLSGSQEFATDNGNRAIRITINSASFTNIGSIRRSQKTTLNINRHILSGSFRMRNVNINADYVLSIDQIGQAPANTASGRAFSVAENVFVNFQFLVDTNGLPQGIQSWRARVGRHRYLGTPNLGGNPYEKIYNTILESSLRSLVTRLLETEIFNFARNQLVGKMEIE